MINTYNLSPEIPWTRNPAPDGRMRNNAKRRQRVPERFALVNEEKMHVGKVIAWIFQKSLNFLT
ncbi:MAG: hypothetical protein QG646_525 [Euryarchaeota archaeon]|nr:hypothetical protein [Euryarchaeota archaeon]